MILSSRSFVVAALSCVSVAAVVVACGSDNDSKFKDDGKTTPIFSNGDGGLGGDSGDDPNGDLFKTDPPPAFCGPGSDGGPTQVAPGGTEECPDDKNKPGCGCANPGEKAACWTGLRKNRNLGGCHDGMATCIAQGEQQALWGACEGQKLPTPGATGEASCSCFSVGLWKIANTSPCIRMDNGSYYAYSTLPPDPGTITPKYCGEGGGSTIAAKDTNAPGNWSTNTLTTDCAGTFDLCFRVKVGDYNNPQASDCQMGESCVHVDYQKENVEQTLPELPPWHTTDSACVQKWEKDTPQDKSPGYGEMVVKGSTVRCQPIGEANDKEFVFNRVQYCPNECRDAANAQKTECVSCQPTGKGSFGGE